MKALAPELALRECPPPPTFESCIGAGPEDACAANCAAAAASFALAAIASESLPLGAVAEESITMLTLSLDDENETAVDFDSSAGDAPEDSELGTELTPLACALARSRSAKNGCLSAALAVMRLFGSYTSIFCSTPRMSEGLRA